MKTTWNKGAPPSIGWWPASTARRHSRGGDQLIRWWDGELWSVAAYSDFTAVEAADCVKFKAFNQNLIEWCDRWWP